MRFGLAVLVVLGVVMGCSGGSGSTSSSSGGAGSIAGLCTSYCDWEARCKTPDSTCQSECTKESSRNEGKWSGAYTSTVESCFKSLACSEDDGACIENFGAADPAYPNIPEVTACNAKRTECSESTTTPDGGTGTQPTTAFSDDYCLSIAALTAEARAKANECLTQPCAGIRDCLIQAGSFNY
jgi:hypothetical protein